MRKLLSLLFVFMSVIVLTGCSSKVDNFADDHIEEALEFLFRGSEVKRDDVEILDMAWFGVYVVFDEEGETFTYESIQYFFKIDIEGEIIEGIVNYAVMSDNEETEDLWDMTIMSKSDFDEMKEQFRDMFEALENDEEVNVKEIVIDEGTMRVRRLHRMLDGILD